MIQACKRCGAAFDLDHVPRNPFKRCPNPACAAPLDKDAVDHAYVEAANPGDATDAQRGAAKKQLHADVRSHGGGAAAPSASNPFAAFGR